MGKVKKQLRVGNNAAKWIKFENHSLLVTYIIERSLLPTIALIFSSPENKYSSQSSYSLHIIRSINYF